MKTKEIDYTKIWHVIIGNKKNYSIVLPVTFVIACALILCVPRYYTCEVALAPETSSNSVGSLASLAGSIGIGGMSKLLESKDAIYPDLYPDIVCSSQFIVQLFDEEVTTKDGALTCDYYTYLLKHQDAPFWEKAIAWLKRQFASAPKGGVGGDTPKELMVLSKEQDDVIKAIKRKIACAVDKKTGVIQLSLKDQDPYIAAYMCNVVSRHLQDFITVYRTNKARHDYEYFSKLVKEAKEKYEEARKKYSSFSDANMGASLSSVKTKLDDLENNMQLLYNSYTALCTQQQVAEAKIQETTPVFTLMERPVVPIKPTGPKRMIIVALTLVLAFCATTVYLYIKQK